MSKLLRILLYIIHPCFILMVTPVFAQDDLSALLDSTLQTRENISATFKSTRIINLQSNETVHKRTLDFRVAHRFGAMGKNSGGNRHNLFGLDESSDIRIAFEYGITEKFTVGVAHHKVEENYELLGKYRLLEQTNDNHIPVAVTLFTNAAYSDEVNPLLNYDSVSTSEQTLRRLSYTAQLIIARKFSSRLSMVLVPTVVHRNFVTNGSDENTVYAIGIGGRMKITHSTALIVDYMYNLGSYRAINNNNGYYNTLGAGVEFETGGHVFSMMFTNAAAIIESQYVTHTMETWTKGGFRFSFNISRTFRL